MPADFLSRNMVESIEISDEDLACLQDKDTFSKSIKDLLQDKPIDFDYRECLPEMLEIAKMCFIEKKIFIPHTFKTYYIYKRNQRFKSITRIEMVPLTVGEKWYLRLILYNQPVLSFKDARTIDGITFQTFQEAALALKLVKDEKVAKIAFQ